MVPIPIVTAFLDRAHVRLGAVGLLRPLALEGEVHLARDQVRQDHCGRQVRGVYMSTCCMSFMWERVLESREWYLTHSVMIYIPQMRRVRVGNY